MNDPTTFRTEALLSFQRALWDLVTPGLRAVAMRATYPLIEARFLFEEVGEEEHMIAAEAEAHVVADFAPPVDVRFAAVSAPVRSRRELLSGEEWIYRRREDGA